MKRKGRSAVPAELEREIRMLASAPHPTVILDADGATVRYANPAFARRLAIRDTDSADVGIPRSLPRSHREPVLELIDAVVRSGGQPQGRELRERRRSHPVRSWHYRAWQSDGRDPGSAVIVLMATDETALGAERDRALENAAQARAANLELLSASLAADELAEMRADVLGFVSHELRTPLTIVLGMSRMLESKLRGSPDAHIAEDIASSAQELDDLIGSMLLLARLDAVDDAAAHPTRLVPIAEDVLRRQRERDRAREYRLRDTSGMSILVAGDETWIRRVLVNLISNAAKYSPADRPVEIVLGVEDGGAVVRVLDEGDGLATDAIDHVFEPFFRGSDHDGYVHGIGLGLAVCRRIIESLGGRIWAANREARGAEFGFWLPLLRADAPMIDEEDE